MGEGPEAGGNVAVFNLERASAALVAEALAEMLPRLRANPLRVVLPGQMAKPLAKKAPADAKLITLTPAGKRLVVACDDPQAMVLVRELVAKLTSPEARDFEIIRLRNGRAAEVARSLDQLFNDQRAGFEPDGKRGDAVKKVQIVADPVTNSLLVKAAPLDQFLIRKLIVNALDSSEPPDASTIRIRLFPLKFAQAPELVKVLRETYRDASKTAVFSADPRSNTLIVRCPPHMDAEITLLVGKLDVEANGK
jgi:type II secretory pathway component GspD/PulD (secretin)